MKNIKIRIWLVVLAILSLISGISINGKWGFVYQFTFISGPDMIIRDIREDPINLRFLIFWLLAFLSHVVLLILPFIPYKKINITKWALYVPLIFIITQMLAVWLYLAFIFIPFLAVWIGLLFYLKQQEKKLLDFKSF